MDEQNLHNELFSEELQSTAPAYPIKRLQRSGDNIVIAGVYLRADERAAARVLIEFEALSS